MTEPYLGEVRMFGFNYAPYNWAACNGALMSLTQNTTLFSLIGTSFGGDGRTNFALPNMASCAPCGVGQSPGLSARTLGESFGSQQVSLLVTEIAPHNHQGLPVWEGGSGTRTPQPSDTSAVSSADVAVVFATPTDSVTLSPMAIGFGGGSLPHDNQQPSLPVNFCIALNGVYPSFP